MKYSYFTCSTRSGKILSRSGEKGDALGFANLWIKESPYYDPQDPLIIEEVVLGEDGNAVEKKIVKEF